MWVNPFWFGVFVGCVCTLIVLFVAFYFIGTHSGEGEE